MENVRCAECENSVFNCECEKPICPICEEEIKTVGRPGVGSWNNLTHCDAHAECKNCGGWLHKEGDDLYYDPDAPEFCSDHCYAEYYGEYGDEEHTHEWPDIVLILELDTDGEILALTADDIVCDCGAHVHLEDNEDKIRDKLVGEFLNICA